MTKVNVRRLVCYEVHADVIAAITRERPSKKWTRARTIRLIQERHPNDSTVGEIVVGEKMDSRVRGNDGEEGGIDGRRHN